MKSTLVIRQAVRPWLESCGAGENILIAVSGGADSLALAACLARESHELAINLIPIIIDHRLQPGSAQVAERTAQTLTIQGNQEITGNSIIDGNEIVKGTLTALGGISGGTF